MTQIPDRADFRPAGWHTVTPRIIAHDAETLVAFIKEVFGAAGDYQVDRPAELWIGDSIVMISDARFPLCIRGKRRPDLATGRKGGCAIARGSVEHAVRRPPGNGEGPLGQYMANRDANAHEPGSRHPLTLWPSRRHELPHGSSQAFSPNSSPVSPLPHAPLCRGSANGCPAPRKSSMTTTMHWLLVLGPATKHRRRYFPSPSILAGSACSSCRAQSCPTHMGC